MSGNKYLLDTNIIIGFLTEQQAIVEFWNQNLNNAELFISQITRIELLSYPEITEVEQEQIKTFLTSIHLVLITDEIENHTIRIRRENRLKLPDAIIVASAVEIGCTLVTCDARIAGKQIPGCSIINPCG